MEIDWFPLWLSLRVRSGIDRVGARRGIVDSLYPCESGVQRQGSVGRGPVTLPLVSAANCARLLFAGADRPGRARSGNCGRRSSDRRWCSLGKPPVGRGHCFTHCHCWWKSARAALESVDRSYERAARTLGASEMAACFGAWTLPLAQTIDLLPLRRSRFARVARRFRK